MLNLELTFFLTTQMHICPPSHVMESDDGTSHLCNVYLLSRWKDQRYMSKNYFIILIPYNKINLYKRNFAKKFKVKADYGD